MQRNTYALSAAIVILILVVAIFAGLYLTAKASSSPTVTSTSIGNSGTVIKVVAAENFWGSLVSQLGGSHVNVTSIVSDPNADPHEYQSSPAVARAFATANLVIINGAGYDSWAQSIINASSNSNQ